MTDGTVSAPDARIHRLRHIRQRKKEILMEYDTLEREEDEILELDQGGRKSPRKVLTKSARKAQFAAQMRKSHERSKAQ